MTVRQALLIVFLCVIASVVFEPITEKLDSVSDALWWRALPWVLLVVFWLVLGIHVWRERHTRQV